MPHDVFFNTNPSAALYLQCICLTCDHEFSADEDAGLTKYDPIVCPQCGEKNLSKIDAWTEER